MGIAEEEDEARIDGASKGESRRLSLLSGCRPLSDRRRPPWPFWPPATVVDPREAKEAKEAERAEADDDVEERRSVAPPPILLPPSPSGVESTTVPWLPSRRRW